MAAAPEPFEIYVDDAVLDDLRARLDATRWPDEVDGAGWTMGSNLAYMKELAAYWRDGYDWREQERRLNALPQFRAEIDGVGIHFVHIEGKGPDPFPLIVSHGWPGSFFEMYKIAGPLTDPAAHGGDPADAFHLVVPSLIGYGFSDASREPGMTTHRMAELFGTLMLDTLGYERFGAQGGDWGSAVTSSLAEQYPASVAGIHLNLVIGRMARLAGEAASPEVEAYRAEMARWVRDESAYSITQGTKPQTLSYALNDSPVGLAGWIVEKWRAWSDCDGDIERSYTKDELLTNVMIYWVTQTINSSVRLYRENRGEFGRTGRIETPTAVAMFPKEISHPPRSLVERGYNVQRWTEMPRGGHFAAMEEPGLLVEDVRAFFRGLR